MIDYKELVPALRKMLGARGNGWHAEDEDEYSWVQDGTRNGVLIDDAVLRPTEVIINNEDFSGIITELGHLSWLDDFDVFVDIGALKPRGVFYSNLYQETEQTLRKNGIQPAHNTTESIVEMVSKTFDYYDLSSTSKT